jgi:hypothetical protein
MLSKLGLLLLHTDFNNTHVAPQINYRITFKTISSFADIQAFLHVFRQNRIVCNTMYSVYTFSFSMKQQSRTQGGIKWSDQRKANHGR